MKDAWNRRACATYLQVTHVFEDLVTIFGDHAGVPGFLFDFLYRLGRFDQPGRCRDLALGLGRHLRNHLGGDCSGRVIAPRLERLRRDIVIITIVLIHDAVDELIIPRGLDDNASDVGLERGIATSLLEGLPQLVVVFRFKAGEHGLHVDAIVLGMTTIIGRRGRLAGLLLGLQAFKSRGVPTESLSLPRFRKVNLLRKLQLVGDRKVQRRNRQRLIVRVLAN